MLSGLAVAALGTTAAKATLQAATFDGTLSAQLVPVSSGYSLQIDGSDYRDEVSISKTSNGLYYKVDLLNRFGWTVISQQTRYFRVSDVTYISIDGKGGHDVLSNNVDKGASISAAEGTTRSMGDSGTIM